MGKISKRSKVVTLAKTKKLDKSHKAKVFEIAQSMLQGFPRCFVLRLENFKTVAFQQLREMWRDSK